VCVCIWVCVFVCVCVCEFLDLGQLTKIFSQEILDGGHRFLFEWLIVTGLFSNGSFEKRPEL